jgi:hypothetical protein
MKVTGAQKGMLLRLLGIQVEEKDENERIPFIS